VFPEWFNVPSLRRLKVVDGGRHLVPSTRKSIWAQLVITAGAALALVVTTSIVSAQADPVYPSAPQVKAAKAAVRDKAAQIAVVEGQLAASNARLVAVQTAAEVAAEKYNLARIQLRERTDAAKAAAERAAAAQKTAGIASDKLGQFAAADYMRGGNLDQLAVFLSSKPQDLLDRASAVQQISDIRSRNLRDADVSSALAGGLRRQAAQAQAQQLAAAQTAESARTAAQAQVDSAAVETASIQKQQRAMIAQLATLHNTSVTLERQRQDGLKAEAEARAAAQAAAQARAAAQRQVASAAEAERLRQLAANQPVNTVPAPTPVSNAPVPPSGGVLAVIAFARAQIGKPYEWGAAGPGTFDCSGLTLMAWAQAGVNLSHYTGFQWAETRRVPLGQLQPGDLVFYGVDGPDSHHVGLYVGNDMMIDAPYTGAYVRYDNIYSFGSDLLPYGGRP